LPAAGGAAAGLSRAVVDNKKAEPPALHVETVESTWRRRFRDDYVVVL